MILNPKSVAGGFIYTYRLIGEGEKLEFMHKVGLTHQLDFYFCFALLLTIAGTLPDAVRSIIIWTMNALFLRNKLKLKFYTEIILIVSFQIHYGAVQEKKVKIIIQLIRL